MANRVVGWLVMDSMNFKPIEFQEQEVLDEPPYSNDEGVLQFPLEIDFSTEYPTAKILTDNEQI